MFRWNKCSGGTNVQVEQMFRWNKCSGGTNVQVEQMFRYTEFRNLAVRDTTLQHNEGLDPCGSSPSLARYLPRKFRAASFWNLARALRSARFPVSAHKGCTVRGP